MYLVHQDGVCSRYSHLGTCKNISVNCLTRLAQHNEHLCLGTMRKGQTREKWTTVTKQLSNTFSE